MYHIDPLDIDLLDSEDPFEVDDGNRPHLFSHAPYGLEDVYDLWAGSPLFYPAVLPAHWLMVGDVPGAVLVVPLAPPKYSGISKARPIGVYEAGLALRLQYHFDVRDS